jgi:aminodeoxychorismate lyase
MLVFLNGEFVPEDRAVVSVFDRSFLYGDGLFETMCVANGKPFRWAQHMERLRSGADFLGIKIPLGGKALKKFAAELIAKNQMPDALLRLTLSRGVGLRGYSPKGADQPTLVMTLHPAPEASGIGSAAWKLITASFRLPAGETLAHFKTANKLAQVLARAEADAAGADEALLLNTDGFVVEGASSNLFWVQSSTVCTPPMTSGVLAGVTRAVVLELCHKLALPVRETAATPEVLREAEGVFLTLSTLGVVPAAELDGVPLRQSPLVEKLHHAYGGLLKQE